jgi:predicted ArsR family transcriptional regulator
MATPESVSSEIFDLVKREGHLTLSEVEENLGVSYNLVFLAMDSLVARHQVVLERQGTEYMLSLAAYQSGGWDPE